MCTAYTIRLKWHHSSKFVNDPNPNYRDGRISIVPQTDPDKLSMLKMLSFVEELDYIAIGGVYFRKKGNEKEDFRKVWSDQVLI